jgi:hypothetical protein
VRIDKPDSTPRDNIRIDHILEENRFSHTGLSDDVDMSSFIVGQNTELAPSSSEVRRSDRSGIFIIL